MDLSNWHVYPCAAPPAANAAACLFKFLFLAGLTHSTPRGIWTVWNFCISFPVPQTSFNTMRRLSAIQRIRRIQIMTGEGIFSVLLRGRQPGWGQGLFTSLPYYLRTSKYVWGFSLCLLASSFDLPHLVPFAVIAGNSLLRVKQFATSTLASYTHPPPPTQRLSDVLFRRWTSAQRPETKKRAVS